MNFGGDTDDTLRRGLNTSAAPSIALLNQKLGTSSASWKLELFGTDFVEPRQF